jgi:hypothetical protein
MSLLFPLLHKIGEWREEQALPDCGGEVDTSQRGEVVEKGCKRVNMVQILHTHEWKQKKDTC